MEKINVAELLKDCPKGMELDCINYNGVVTFEEISNCPAYPIKISIKYDDEYFTNTLTKYGQTCNSPYNKCIIFPKGKTTWEGFQRPFVDGDIVTNIQGAVIIYKKITTYGYCGSFVSLDHYNKFIPHYESYLTDTIRLATEEEKQKLFDSIKANGYKWNPETKTLEKLPMFKVGDRIVDTFRKCMGSDSSTGRISQITDDKYIFTDGSYIYIKNQDNWELVPNKFDINTLKPFDKVLARDAYRQVWIADFFSHNIKGPFGGNRFACIGHYWHQCIPYEGNEHLLGKADDCDEYFKTWK